MPIVPIFSKRNKKKEFDVYRYDDLPLELRRQIIHIWVDSIGTYRRGGFNISPSPANQIWDEVTRILCKEYGVFSLSDKSSDNSFEQCQDFILNSSCEKALDIIEVTFKGIDRIIRKQHYSKNDQAGIRQSPDSAISELNDRFKEHGIGYQYLNGRIIKIDSEFLHTEAILPVLHLLHDESFKGAEDEFLKAHEHYRHKKNKEAISECLKSFESCLKDVCTRKKWTFPPKATSRGLIDVVIKNQLISEGLLAHFTGLRATLEAGVPAIRNSNGGHGQGPELVFVPEYLVAYTLNITASALLLIVNAYKEKK
jgi:hypothetical protein